MLMHFRCWLPCRGTMGVCSPLTRGHGAHSGQTCNKAKAKTEDRGRHGTTDGGEPLPRAAGPLRPWLAGAARWPLAVPRLPSDMWAHQCIGPRGGKRARPCAVLSSAHAAARRPFFFLGRGKVLASPSHRPRILRLPGWRHCCRLPVPVQPRWVSGWRSRRKRGQVQWICRLVMFRALPLDR
jgi:hypothetical protein